MRPVRRDMQIVFQDPYSSLNPRMRAGAIVEEVDLGWKRADVYAGGPPDSWQILEAVVVGNRVTATLNGKKVHDNALLPAITGGAMDNDELAPGPIMIQGDHSKVSFRKLVITPITKPGT